MIRGWFRVIAALLIVFIPALSVHALAETEPPSSGEEREPDGDFEDELERQLGLLDLEGFERYCSGLGSGSFFGAESEKDLIRNIAEKGPSAETGLWDIAKELTIGELRGSLGAVAALAGAAMLTALAGCVSGKGERSVLSFALSFAVISLSAALFASLYASAGETVKKTAELSEIAMPVMTTLLISSGSASSAGIFRPLMVFLSGTVIKVISSVVMPLVLAGGVLGLVDPLTGESRLSELVTLIKKLAKWILGLMSSLYFAMTALRGLTAAAYDGVAVRTAKFAVDKLVPIVGGMVGGTVDSVMSCALLIKNGLGCVTVILLLSVLIKPLAVLASGSLVFRAAAAFSQPVADPRAVKLLSGAADITSYLFACVAAAGSMLALTVFVFIAAGGITAGLW